MSEATGVVGGGDHFGFWLVTGLTVAAAAVAAVWLRKIDWI
jgi:hypothetical protein